MDWPTAAKMLELAGIALSRRTTELSDRHTPALENPKPYETTQNAKAVSLR